MKTIYNCVFACALLLSYASISAELKKETDLLSSLKKGSVEWKRLIHSKDHIHTRDQDGNTPLHLAALHQNHACLTLLIKSGADVNASNVAGATPLLYGITNVEIVRTLLEHKANPNAISNTGMTPLLAAVSRGQSYVIAKLLVDAGADVKVMREGPWDGGALYRAIQSGDPRTVDLMFDKGAPMEPKGKSFSPLHVAAMVGDLKSVKRLVEAGVDLNYSDNGWGDAPGHALNWAMWAENHDIASYLIHQGIDLNFAPSIGNQTPPMVWAGFGQQGHTTIAAKLIQHGLDINTTNAVGETALTYALKSGANTVLVKFFIENGAQMPSVNSEKIYPSRPVPSFGLKRKAMIRESAQKAIDLMQYSSETFLQRRDTCISCHHQLLPALAYGMARERGLSVDALALGHQIKKQTESLDQNARNDILEFGFGGFSGGRGLVALHTLGYQADEDLLNIVRSIRETQSFDGTWSSFGRPPIEEPSPFQQTAWAVRSLIIYPRHGEEVITKRSVHRAMEWLRKTEPDNPNQRNLQLLGLSWGGEPKRKLRLLANAILAQQRADGGWAQLPTLKSDAWATGQTLYALHVGGGISTDEPSFQRGIEFLLRTQFDDGSWWVKNRTWPFQPHFDSGFPHGKDQWVSIGATAWATMALLTTIEPVKSSTDFPTGQELVALWKERQKENQRNTVSRGKVFKEQTVDFQAEIQPILERSCISCHSGNRAKGDFVLNSKESLLLGGQSEIPSIVPGDAGHSPLIRFVTDQVEDMEMPPLGKRDKYPALTQDEVRRLSDWIEEGGNWPENVVLD